jgi:hypothetical protein
MSVGGSGTLQEETKAMYYTCYAIPLMIDIADVLSIRYSTPSEALTSGL